MTIYLRPPEPHRAGPDGQGWNRISLNSHLSAPSPQCALQPRTYPALYDIRRGSRVTAWGPYNRCIRPRAWGDATSPNCLTCPVTTTPPRELTTETDRVRVRITTRTIGTGFASQAEQTPHLELVDATGEFTDSAWTWAELARLPGWDIGRAVTDHRRPGFWIHRNTADQ